MANETAKLATAPASSMTIMTLRPPIRSAIMPAGSRHIEPLSTATALIQLSCTSVSPNSFWMGLPRMPNISHTANISVNAMVDMAMTRPAPLPVSWIGATSMRCLLTGGDLSVCGFSSNYW